MKRYIKVLAFLFMIGLVACEYEYIVKEDVIIDQEDPISFETQIEPVFQNKCIVCHSVTSLNKKPFLTTGTAYTSLTNGNYINADNPTESKIYTEPQGNHGAVLNATELALLAKWIEEGAEDN